MNSRAGEVPAARRGPQGRAVLGDGRGPRERRRRTILPRFPRGPSKDGARSARARPKAHVLTGPALCLGIGLFLTGAAFGHFVLFAIAAHFFTTFGSSSVHVLLSVGTFFSFYIQFVLSMGAAFQIPTVVLVLSSCAS